MIAKLSLVDEEADESLYWMELLVDEGVAPEEQIRDLMAETKEILP